ncbi:trigger factor [Pinisolibacter aquiterrae]|uniref:trigger factor n=1 Tax=Pinisolibacter aquiterrae TaxID=2815579 RepID=UPI001C3C5FD8|nr:trigger factor [Pinisolibacter aquiterrae]MBV5263918.1 trigger factor [Pinisolibacter aquiterrae]MCC8235929.1 trigger factor [Pinisolibacter aquiterrae]
MQVTETLSEGLKRELSITVPAADLVGRLDKRLAEIKDTVRINGFRPGKVPTAHLKRLVGAQEMARIVDEVIGESIREVVEGRGERPALNPDVALAEGCAAEAVVAGDADLVFTAAYELLPNFEIADWSAIEVERAVVPVKDEEVEERLKQIAEGNRPFADKAEGEAAATGDRVKIDFVGTIEGVPFDGGSAEGVDLVLGSNQFIPGFEDQLVGAKVGDEVVVKVSFPEDYAAAHLAGKPAEFACKVTAIAAPGELVIDDEWASKLGIDSLDKLREIIKEQIGAQYAGATRAKVKRALLDKLDEQYTFDLPEKLVEGEFENIWNQAQAELQQTGKTFADEGTTEDEAKADYRKIATRRVRLGLVLSEVGEKREVKVTDEEVQRALIERVRQFPGQEKQVFDYYRSNAMALASLRAPIFEEKVIDLILAEVKVTDKEVTAEELLAETEEA